MDMILNSETRLLTKDDRACFINSWWSVLVSLVDDTCFKVSNSRYRWQVLYCDYGWLYKIKLFGI